MNKTHKQIVYSILESIYEHKIPDDHDISEEFVKLKVDDVNIRLVEEAFKQGDSLDAYYQKQCCIQVECDKTACLIDGVMLPSGDVSWFSEIPTLNQKVGWRNIAYLGTSDMRTSFKRVSFSYFMSGAKLDWTNGTVYTVVGNKIYFQNLPTTGSKMLCMVGILSSPTTACNWNDDTPYPTPDAYKLELLVKQDILSTFPAMPKDEQQDGRDNVGSVQGRVGEVKPPQNE